MEFPERVDRWRLVCGASFLVPLMGSAIPFSRTNAERAKTGDPRRSLEERYPSKDRYMTMAKSRADALVKERYLLAGDVTQVLKRIEDQWNGAPASTASR